MNALDLLTARLFDYAGTFPPASLSIGQAMAESARAARLVRPRILGTDLVLPLPDLKHVNSKELQNAGFGDTLCAVAVVGVDQKDMKRAARRVLQFNEKSGGVARITSLEVHGKKFEAPRLHDTQKMLGNVRLYVEPDIGDASWPRAGMALVALLGRLNAAGSAVGLKVRGSGRSPISSRSVARLLPEVARHGIPLKATAGIHHPVLEDAYGNRLGFVNLAAALRLRQALGEAFGAKEIAACLLESQPDAFSFEGELAWRGHAVSEERLGELMDQHPFSVGSCSLREPDEDLVRLFGAPA